MRTLDQDIKNHSFQPVYCIYGEESYLRRFYKEQIRAAVLNGDTMNYQLLEDKSATVSAIMEAADSLPFLSDYYLVIVQDSGLFSGKSGEKLIDYLSVMPESTVLFFIEKSVSDKNRLLAAVKEKGCVMQLKKPDDSEMTLRILKILNDEGKKIRKSTMNLFMDYADGSLDQIFCELEKLLSYVGERTVITSEDIEAVCSSESGARVYSLTDAVIDRNSDKAMSIYNDLLAQGTDPGSIFSNISSQFNQLLQIRLMSDEGLTQAAIASSLKLRSSYRAGILYRKARSMGTDDLRSCVEICAELETSFKQGKMSQQLAAEYLLARLSSRSARP